MFEIYPSPRPKIDLIEGGFSVSTPDGVDKVFLEKVRAVAAYKRDEITVDRVCCDIETASQNGPMLRTIHEEMVGFHEAMAELEKLPGFYRYWREYVILPAFQQNYTELYRQGCDFSKLDVDNPPRDKYEPNHPIELSEEPRFSRTGLLTALIAVVAFIAVFHIIMR
ncbi:hypothetical protein [Sphingomonas sp. Root710]|uniref:hypothetical protein n=1 Tax=Sphingomonas sp. Root710 TaxID=1736594 RepID=UPI0012E39681|nr:hypothetical protein [Sphingomonas sp. Root710]